MPASPAPTPGAATQPARIPAPDWNRALDSPPYGRKAEEDDEGATRNRGIVRSGGRTREKAKEDAGRPYLRRVIDEWLDRKDRGMSLQDRAMALADRPLHAEDIVDTGVPLSDESAGEIPNYRFHLKGPLLSELKECVRKVQALVDEAATWRVNRVGPSYQIDAKGRIINVLRNAVTLEQLHLNYRNLRSRLGAGIDKLNDLKEEDADADIPLRISPTLTSSTMRKELASDRNLSPDYKGSSSNSPGSGTSAQR
ncbi:hypothetical protein PUNSTDRAFT_134462 [Punctularia strigosozonata HHB-11173 SS5]|uniref:uncharacterized protein n=1 Tax=Punctularia strigosozonata (strain HHB-11173) TaxID=741275 RepID=UPI0004416D3E|nr:uncharacterized protein PUNSTDRAFT_134462 [Punctularia strigosozonata HHB-11173 SS5]EIN09308.1 hypothetical protein PUNSTDRAFT_134462 [Punctularia strigosozonata HHB-11173 SS5]